MSEIGKATSAEEWAQRLRDSRPAGGWGDGEVVIALQNLIIGITVEGMKVLQQIQEEQILVLRAETARISAMMEGWKE